MAASCSAETCMSGMALLRNTDYIFECLPRLSSIVSIACYLHPPEGWKELLRYVQRGWWVLCISSWEVALLSSLSLRKGSSTELQSYSPLLIFLCPLESCICLCLSPVEEQKQRWCLESLQVTAGVELISCLVGMFPKAPDEVTG